MSRSNGKTQLSEYRRLPSVDRLLQMAEVGDLVAAYGAPLVTETLRELVATARGQIARGERAPSPESWARLLEDRLVHLVAPRLRPIINATGVIIHTNLGRAPLSEDARRAINTISCGYSNLEYDTDQGRRGSRYSHARELLTALTGAEDALVVNNCASAVFLALSALCRGREVVVSRGQLVEIGGGFRIPDVLRQSGATLVEVGTTNRTHPQDFARAVNEKTAAFMRIHASNFRQIGFVSEPSLPDLVETAQQNKQAAGRILVMDDLGSGTLLDTTSFGLGAEPMVQQSVAAGSDVVAFSGDKLLGGPQAGILVGKEACITQMRQHPLARALRVDKMTLAALEATLHSYRAGRALTDIPVWRMLSRTVDDIRAQANGWHAALEAKGISSSVWEGESTIGGGSLPGESLPTLLLALSSSSLKDPVDEAAASLRHLDPSLICRIQQDHLLFDPRTVLDEQSDVLLEHICAVAKSCSWEGKAS